MKKGFICEVVGVAGSGKTTLLNHLIDNYDCLDKNISTKKARYFHLWLMSFLDIAKCYFGATLMPRKPAVLDTDFFFPSNERYRYFEVRLLLQLSVLTRIVEKRSKNNDNSIVLDQGPIYMIAALYVVCNAKAKMYQNNLIAKCFERYISVLSHVVFLDLPFDCLEKRWRERPDWADYKDVFGTEKSITYHHNMFKKEYLSLVGEVETKGVKITKQKDPFFDLGNVAKQLFQE